MRKPTRLSFGEGRRRWGRRATRAPNCSAGVVATACAKEGSCATREAPRGGWRGGAGQRWCREARSRPLGVADRVVVPLKPGNAGGGKDPWSGNGAGRNERRVDSDHWNFRARCLTDFVTERGSLPHEHVTEAPRLRSERQRHQRCPRRRRAALRPGLRASPSLRDSQALGRQLGRRQPPNGHCGLRGFGNIFR